MARGMTIRTARRLRRTMSSAEVRLWTVLRGRPEDVKFRRQHPLGRYVLDFYCPAAQLAVEVDGAYHDRGNAPERDAERDEVIAGYGIRTVRIPAEAVFRDLDGVVRYVLDQCRLPLHHRATRDGPPPHATDGEE